MDSERQPLLSSASPPPRQHSVSIANLTKSLAALRAGKLPSSAQTAKVLRAALASSLLQIEHTIFSTRYGSGRIGTGALTREGELVQQALRSVAEALLVLVEEKDPDDRIQDFFYASRQAHLHFRLPSCSVPSPSPDIVESAHDSLHNLVILFVTSPHLRALVRDVIFLAQDVFHAEVEDTGLGEAGEVATAIVDKLVEKFAGSRPQQEEPEKRSPETPLPRETHGDAEESAPSGGATPDEARPSPPPPPPPPPPKPEKSAEETRDEFIDRFKDILVHIQASPKYQRAVGTLLHLLKTYIHQIIHSASGSASLETPVAIPSLAPVLEPFAGGPSSLAPLHKRLAKLAQYTREENRISSLLASLDTFVSKALLEPAYLSSSASHREAAQLHSAFLQLAEDNPSFRSDVSGFLQEAQKALEAIANDRALGRLMRSLGELGEAVDGWLKCATRVAVGQEGAWGDIIEWVVPRIGSLLTELSQSLPRIEFTSEFLDVAVDAPPFLNTSFIPDSIQFLTSTALSVSPFAPAPSTSFSSSSTLNLVGLRMETTSIGYFLRYRGLCCFPIVESGLLDIHFGTGDQGGVGATLEFESTPDDDPPSPSLVPSSSLLPTPPSSPKRGARKTLFTLSTTQISIDSFDVRPHESTHPILVWFLRPLLRRALRTQVESLLEEKVREGLEGVSRLGWEIRERVRRSGEGAGWREVIEGVADILFNGYAEEEEEGEGEGGEDADEGDAVNATLREEERASEEEDAGGQIVHVSSAGVTVELEDGGTVGIGQEGVVLPVGDAETPLPHPSVADIIQERSEEVLRDGKKAAETLVNGLEDVGEAVGGFGEEVEEERERRGWRSAAFDWTD